MQRPPPSRFVNADAARQAFGGRADTLASFLWQTDPLAEAVVQAFSALPPGKGKRLLDRALEEGIEKVPSAPRALIQLFEHVHHAPFWVDREQIAFGGRALLRTGLFGLLALGGGSLPLTYAPPHANKPLTFTKRLVEMAPRRILDTMRFHYHTCVPGGIEPGGEGFKITIRVRLVHAQMRRVLLASGRWNEDVWGAPINQADKAYANLLFSAYPIDWLRRLGIHFTSEEIDAAMQLWRYSGHIMGVDPVLLPATEAEARRLGTLYQMTQDEPDEDSRALARALADSVAVLLKPYFSRTLWSSDAFAALSRFLLGDAWADKLGYPKNGYRSLIPVVRAAVAQSERIRRLSGDAHDLAFRAGAAFERGIVEGGLASQKPSEVGTIEALLGAARRPPGRG